jgi:hypothetical protein
MPQQSDTGEHASALAHDEHGVKRIQSSSAVRLIDQKPRPAGLTGGRPQVGQLALAIERIARLLQSLEAGKRPAGGLAQEYLLV